MIPTVLFNLALAAIDAATFAGYRRSKDRRMLAVGVAAAGFATLFLSASLGGGMFGAMRLLAWGIFVHGVVLLGGIAWLLRDSHRKSAIAAGLGALLIALTGVDAFLIEPHWLEVTRVRLVSQRLKRPLRIAVVADLQTDEIGDYERSILRRVMAEKPDLILLAGDYIQEHDADRRANLYNELREALRATGFGAPMGAIAVEGNCDDTDWPVSFEGLPIDCVRETRAIRLDGIQVTALDLKDSFNPRLQIGETDAFHIVVGHAPDFALGKVQADLLVAGHTHGGQVRLPFIGPLVTLSSVPRAWAAGVTTLEGARTLVVSRGIGMERGHAPRLRFLCRPELLIIEAVPER